MEWTWRRTLIGLCIAVLLGTAMVLADARLRTLREEIMQYGQQVRVQVVGETSGLPKARDSVVEYAAYGRAHRAEISDGYRSDLPIGSSITLNVDPTRPERLADLDGYSSLASRRLPHYLGALAAVVALVSIAGRIGTVTTRRRQRRRRSYA